MDGLQESCQKFPPQNNLQRNAVQFAQLQYRQSSKYHIFFTLITWGKPEKVFPLIQLMFDQVMTVEKGPHVNY
jgi:hypothetical protein